MRKMRKFFSVFPDEEGIAAPVTGLLITTFIVFLAIAIDLGQLYVIKNELQNAADGAALAGANALSQQSQYIDVNAINTAVQNCAAQNKSIGLSSLQAFMETGKWNFATQTFTPIPNPSYTVEVNAVRVRVSRMGSDDGQSNNPKVPSYFASILGINELTTTATAVAYLGITGTSSLDIPFALPDSILIPPQANLRPGLWQLFWDAISPPQAYALAPKTLPSWQDLGGSPDPWNNNLDLSRGTWVDSSSSPSYSRVLNYIKGTTKFPQVKVADKLYPMSEWRWGGNVKNFFNALKTRYNAKKDANGKWRVTVAIYDPTKPTAAAPPEKPWTRLAFWKPSLISKAYACASYKIPAVYIDGFVAVDITGVTVNASCVTTSGTNSQGQYYQVVNPNSCRNTCSVAMEIPPLDQNQQATDANAMGNNFQRTYQDMNSSSNPVALWNKAAKLVK